MVKKEKTILRDSGTGRFISKRQAAKKSPKAWQMEHVPVRSDRKLHERN